MLIIEIYENFGPQLNGRKEEEDYGAFACQIQR